MPVQSADPASTSASAVVDGQKTGSVPPAEVLSAKIPESEHGKRLTGFIKIPREALFPGLGQILFLSCVVVVMIISTFFMGIPGILKDASTPSTYKQGSGFVVPVNVAEVEYPEGVVLEKFLENFQNAAKETDYQKRYSYMEENFSILLGFYSSTHDPKIRGQLEAYSAYMQNNFGSEYKKNTDFYKVPCWDSGCGNVNYLPEIEEIKGQIEASTAFADSEKQSLGRQLEVAALSEGVASQGSAYVNTLSAGKSNYDKT